MVPRLRSALRPTFPQPSSSTDLGLVSLALLMLPLQGLALWVLSSHSALAIPARIPMRPWGLHSYADQACVR